MLADKVTFSNLTDRQIYPPYGLDGGEPGTLGATLLNPDTDREERLESKGTYTLAKNDVVSFLCSGSGGFGSPLEREREKVLEDIREERISIEAAKQFYQVIPDDEEL